MDNDNSQAPSGGDELKKLGEELKGLGSNQEVPVQTPATEQTAPATSPLTPTPLVKETTLPPEPRKSPNKILMIAIGFLVLALAGAAGYLFLNKQTTPKACTEDAKLCPDGSAVGRVGPNCEFAPCPIATADPTANWKTYTNNYWNTSFKYPDTLFKPCPTYTTEEEGIRFWGSDFDCPEGHDILYKIGLVGYGQNKYKEYKTPAAQETILIAGRSATKKTYVYDESDGPLFGAKQSVEIVVSLEKGTLVLQQLGVDTVEQKAFEQILSTFKFIDTSAYVCPTGEDPNCDDYLPNAGVRLECTPEYQSWAIENCPTYKTGAASSPTPKPSASPQ